jgi:eukaryotic-like serine/threonine-protein kinase
MSAQLYELFERASAATPSERSEIVEALRSRDPELAEQLAGMLAASAREGTVLDRPAWTVVGDETPTQVGPYRILEQIGRGGMGRVFLAEQQGEGFVRTVALKLLDALAPSEHGVTRFHDERRILASLEHPGIARFYDGGRTTDGRWFLAMEYVEGDDLLTYARREAPSIAARVRVLLGVIEAVQYAHARLVVHRDLKPANVLVGSDGRPRLLDFGISKLVDPEAQAHEVTRTELRAMTPAYASPEQIRGERVTAASDVWSLGVMLYELLAERRPFASAEASARAIELAVLELDPPPPSTVARTVGALPPVPADLDAIVERALRKSTADRYPSAEALGDDLQRFLDGLPVRARRGGRRYRLGKLLRRHKLAIISGSAAALALTAGLGVALWQRAQAVAERERAEQRFADVEALAQSMLFEIHDGVAELPNSGAVRELIAERALEYLERLRADAGDDPALLFDLAAGYERVGGLLGGGPGFQRRPGGGERGEQAFAQAVAIRRRLLAREPDSFTRGFELARTLGLHARGSIGMPDRTVAQASLDEVVAIADGLAAREPDRAELAYLRASTAVTQLRLATVVGADRAAAFAEATQAWAALVDAPELTALEDAQLGMDAAVLARLLHDEGRDDEAAPLAVRAIALLERGNPGSLHTGLAYAYAVLAFHRRAHGEPREALALHDRAMVIRRSRLDDREAPVSAAIAFFDSLLDEAELALAVPELERAAHALDEAERVVERMGWSGPDGDAAREQIAARRSELARATPAAPGR